MPEILRKLLAQNGRKAKKGQRRLKAVKPNRRAELNYAAELLTITRQILTATKSILLPELKALEPEYGYARDAAMRDAYAERVTAAIAKLAKSVGTNANTKARHMAARAVVRAKNSTDAQLTAAARQSIGIDIGPVLRAAPLAVEIDAAIAANTALIKSIPQTYMAQIRQLVLDGVQQGKRYEVLQREILARYAVSESRARLIARDQTAKLTSAITEARQTQLGIKKYEWQTSGDERVRDSHAALDGKIIAWNDPPAVGHPGQDYQCRCTAIPIFDL